MEPGSLQWCPATRQRGNEHKLEHVSCILNTKKHFKAWVTEQRHELPRKVVQSPPLEILKKTSRHGHKQPPVGGST